ncbi:14986_t:CDS:2, partial [Funneliformis geosporum]
EHEARFTNLKQKDKEKATLIAKLDYDIKKIKQSLAKESDQINVLEVLPPKEATASILLTHISNTSDNSKEEAWFNEDMFFNE